MLKLHFFYEMLSTRLERAYIVRNSYTFLLKAEYFFDLLTIAPKDNAARKLVMGTCVVGFKITI